MQAADTDFGPYRPMKGGPDVMSENDPRFMRGTRQRASLPVVRSANQSKEKTLGVLYLQYGGETRQTVMPNAVTTLDTVRALFVKAFPDLLSMSALEAPDAAFLLRDASSTATFRLLSDLREITNKATLKVGFRAPVNRQPQAVNGGDVWEESARRLQSTGYRHGSLSGAATPTVPQSPAQRHYSLQQRQQQQQSHHHYQQQQQSVSGAAAGFISGIQGPSAFSPAAAFFGAPSPAPSMTSVSSAVAPLGSILERRDVRPDEDMRNRDVLLVRGDAGTLHYPQALVGGGRYSLAASGPTVVSTYSSGDRGGRSGPWDDSALRSYATSSSQRLGSDGGGHHHHQQQQQQHQQRARSRTPPASLHALQASLAPRTVVAIPLDEPDYAGRRWGPAWGAAATLPEQPRRVSVGSSEAGATTPFRPIGHADDSRETRERMESMERQIASLTELLHRSVTREEAVASGAAPSVRAGASASTAAGSYASQSAFGGGGGAARAMRGRDESRQRARVTAARLHGGIAQLRTELQEIRRLQLSQRAAWQCTLASVRQEVSSRLAGEAARVARDEPARRLRAQADDERQVYVEKQHAAQHRLSELEEAVETLRSRASLPGIVSLTDVDEGEELLRQLEEEIATLRGQFPGMQSRMRGLLRVEVEAMKFLKDEPHKLDDLQRGCRDLATTLVLLRRSIVDGTAVDEPEKPSHAEPDAVTEKVARCDAYVPHFASSHRGLLSHQQQQEQEMQQQREKQEQERQLQEQEKLLRQQQEQQQKLLQQQQEQQLRQQQEQQQKLLQQQQEQQLRQQQEQEKLLQQQQERLLQQQQQTLLQQQHEEQLRQQKEQQKLLQQQQEQHLRQQQEQQKLLQQQQAATPTTVVTASAEVVVQGRTVEVTRTEANVSEEAKSSEVTRGGGGDPPPTPVRPADAGPSVETITVYIAQVSDVPERPVVEAAEPRASEAAEAAAVAEAKRAPEKRDPAGRHVTFAGDLEALSLESGGREAGRSAMARPARSTPLCAPAPAEEVPIPPPPTMSPPPPPPRGGKGYKFVRTTPAEVLFKNRKANKAAVDARADQSEEDAGTPPGSSSKPEDNGQASHMTIELQDGAPGNGKDPTDSKNIRAESGDVGDDVRQPAVAFEEEITDFSSGRPGRPGSAKKAERAAGKVVFQEKDVVDSRAQAPKTITIRYIEEITSESTDEDGEPSPGGVKEKLAFLIRESHVQAVTHDEAALIADGDGLTTFTFTSKPRAHDDDEAESPGGGGGGDGGRGDDASRRAPSADSDARAETGGDAGGGGGEVTLRDKKPLIVIFDEPMDIRSAYKRLSTIFEEKDLEEYQEDETEDDDDDDDDNDGDDDDDSSSFEFNEREAARVAAEEARGPAGAASPPQPAPGPAPEAGDKPYGASREIASSEPDLAATGGGDARPSPGQSEHRPPGKDGGKSKFKIKFPRKQLAALTSALRSGTRSGKKTLELVLDGDEASDGDGDGALASMNPYAQVDGSGAGCAPRPHADAEGRDGADGEAARGPDGPDDGAHAAEGPVPAAAATESEQAVTRAASDGASGGRPDGSASGGLRGEPAGFHSAGMVAASAEPAHAKPPVRPKPTLLPKPSFAPEQPLQNGKSAAGAAELTSNPSTPKQGQKAMRVLHSITSSVRQVSKSGGAGGGAGGGGGGTAPTTASPQRKHKA